MYHLFIKTRDREQFATFKKFRNHLQRKLKKAKQDYYQQLFSDIRNEPKLIWNAVNKITSRKSSIAPQTPLMNKSQITNMNEHFVLAGSCASKAGKGSAAHAIDIQPVTSTIFLQPTDNTEMKNLINSMKSTASAGPDGIRPEPIKHVSSEISDVVAHTVDLSLSSGIFPDALKTARVTPIHKGGTKDQASNYRPISVLNIFSKLFESIVVDRLWSFLSKHNVISNYQYGFQKNKSAEQALLDIKDKIIENTEKRKITLGLFLDLRKAFASIDRKILIYKLEIYGIRGGANDLLRSYLTNRNQFVQLNSIASDILPIRQGVPQGSKLGPLLFLIYVNDIVQIPDSPDLAMYADDTNAFFTSNHTSELTGTVNEYLNRLSVWLRNNNLELNTAKTIYILFRARNKIVHSDINIFFNGAAIEHVKEQKFLGVWFDDHLSWSSHIRMLCNDLSKSVGIINRISQLIPLWLKQQLYNALIYSKLCYGVLVWGTTSKTNYNKLIILQKRILRIYCNYHGRYLDLETAPLFKRYSLLRADKIYYKKLLVTIHKEKLFTKTDNVGTAHYKLRRSTRHVPKTRTNYGQQTFTYQ